MREKTQNFIDLSACKSMKFFFVSKHEVLKNSDRFLTDIHKQFPFSPSDR